VKSIITWFVDNSVAANLLMWILIVGGLISVYTVHKEQFPNVDPEVVSITVPYLGAAPEEVEKAVCIRIEQALEGVVGVESIVSFAMEGNCMVQAPLDMDTDTVLTVNEIKSRVDAINTFPAETERPTVSKFMLSGGVAAVVISGNTSPRVLKDLAYQVRDELVAIPGISQVETTYLQPDEIAIEVSEYALRKHGLSISQVADAVRRSSLDMPGGSIKTEGGEILLRTMGQAYAGAEFEGIVILTRADGTRVTLGDVATVTDGFAEGVVYARFDGEPAVMVKIQRVGKEDINQMAQDIVSYVARKNATLPEGLRLTVWRDESESLKVTLWTLVNSAAFGLVLVMLLLTLFLRFRLALWVAAGIPIALSGVIATFPFFDLSISGMSVMAFILVLGILVDDAIVVGERVYAHELESESRRHAAIAGTWEVAVPVIFGVLTTMAAFAPMLFSGGRMGQFFIPMAAVVVITLAFSIIESQMILPAHLRHRKATGYLWEGTRFVEWWIRFQSRLAHGLMAFANNIYAPFLRKTLEWRYVTLAVGSGFLLFVLAMIASGRIVFDFMPSMESDSVYATLTMVEGINVNETIRASEILEEAAYAVRDKLDENRGPDDPSMVTHVLSSVGTQLDRGNGPARPNSAGVSHLAEVALELQPTSIRGDLNLKEVADAWRELVPVIPDAVELTFSAETKFSAGDAFALNIKGRNIDDLRLAAAELRAELGRYDGVKDITDSFRSGKQEIQLRLLPAARNFGITQSDLGRQVRQAFYGEEVQRIPRESEDVRAMVRFPKSDRQSIGNLEDMRVRTPDGSEVPLTSVAEYALGRGYSAIERDDGQRVVTVRADVDSSVVTPQEVMNGVLAVSMPQILAKYPTVSYAVSGQAEEQAKSLGSLVQGFAIAIIVIYALLAIPLHSYIQPLVIMSVIPFGAVGAMLGHWLLNTPLVFPSILGMVALSGVVVNASLVLVDYINKQRLKGASAMDAVSTSGIVRFRPIFLTSITTFAGLVPLMFWPAPEMAFFVPMAISLAWGVIAATTITLFLVPCLYLIAEDFFTWHGIKDREDIVDDRLKYRDEDEQGVTAG
jgi:multidrug efflux pump subunit AcrB